MIPQLKNALIYSFRGLKTVWKEERNFRLEVIIGLIVIFCLFYFDFTYIESVFCIIAITLVIAGEIINTIVEDLCNKVEPNHDSIIGKIKDMSAAFVLVSSISSVIIGILVFYNHFK